MEYTTGPVTLRKGPGSALGPDQVGNIDIVLLSHDHHFDNLNHSARKFLKNAANVLTTAEGAERFDDNSIGLREWESIDWPAAGGTLRVIATPARHGPAVLERGAVVGFVLFFTDELEACLYFSGDTVWYEGVTDIARRFPVRVAIFNLGAARVPAVGPLHLTMNAEEATEAAPAFRDASIVPLHFEGWEHFSEGRQQLQCL